MLQKKLSPLVLVLMLLLSAGPGLLKAQTGTSFTMMGTVFDQQRAVLPGATVTIRNTSTGFTRVVVTKDNGQFTAAALPPTGNYEIVVEMPGFKTERRTGLVFEANSQPVIDFVLQVGSPQEEITVTSAAPLVERSKSEISDVVGEKSVEELPLGSSRNFFDYALLAGGGVRTGGGSGNVTFNGVGARNLTILTDGVSAQNREIRTQDLAIRSPISLETIKEVQVITNSFSAEFGRSPSAVINAITRSGTNDIHGSFFWIQRLGKTDAKNPLTRINPEVNKYNFGGTIGGPIIKDRTHFFFSGDKLNEKFKAGTVTSVLEPAGSVKVIPNREEERWTAKIDHELTSKHHFDFRLSRNDADLTDQGFGGLTTTERAFVIFTDEWRQVYGLTSALTPTLVNEFRFQFGDTDFDDFPVGIEPSLPPDFSTVGPAINRPGIGFTGPAPFLPQNLFEDVYQVVNKTSWSRGAHNVKFGIDWQKTDRRVTFFNNFTGTFTFAEGTPFPFDPDDPATFPITFSQAFGNSDLRFGDWQFGSFVQDDYRIRPGLTVNLGLRYDYSSAFKDLNNFAPRIGLAWDLFGTGKTVIRASYGHFFGIMETSLINRESNEGPQGIQTIFLQQGDPLFPAFPNTFDALPEGADVIRDRVFIPLVRGFSEEDFPLSVGEQNKSLRRTPYSQHTTFGIQQKLLEDLVLTIDYTFVRGLKLLRTRDLNAPPFFEIGPDQTRSLAEADALRPFGVPSQIPGPLGVQFGGFRRMFIQESGDQSFYHAMKLGVTKRFGNGFSFDVNYVLSKSISDSDNFRENSSLPTDPNNLNLDRGFSDTDRRHNFIGHGIFELPWGFRYTLIVNAVSGARFTGEVGFDANGDGNTARDRPGQLGRNTFALGTFFQIDSSLAKVFDLYALGGETHRVEFRVDAFNLFNHFNEASANDTIGLDANNPPASFGRITSVSDTRNLQFSVRYLF